MAFLTRRKFPAGDTFTQNLGQTRNKAAGRNPRTVHVRDLITRPF